MKLSENQSFDEQGSTENEQGTSTYNSNKI
jgi:hypothetical protein